MKSHGILRLTTTSPTQTFTEPITLAEAKLFLRVDSTDDDALIAALIPAAREMAEIFQMRDLVEKQYDMTLDCFPGIDCPIELRSPLSAVSLVQYKDDDGDVTAMVENVDYIVDLERGLIAPAPNQYWPVYTEWPSGSVLIRFSSGYSAADPFWSDAGMRVKQGMLMLIAQWYEHREGINSAAMNELPFAVTALLSMGANASVA